MSRAAVARSPSILAAGVCALVAALCVGAPVAARVPDAKDLTLRLADVGAGYGVGDDSGCGGVSDERSPRSLVRLERRYRPRRCDMEFERLWVQPGGTAGPPLVESVALMFRGERGALAAYRVRRDLVAYALGLRRRSLKRGVAPSGIGDTAALYRTNDALVGGRSRRPGVALVWRSDRVLSVVFAGGLSGSPADDAIVRLAGLQQARIARPTPLARSDNDDREVPLNDPGLGVPVQWVGQHLRQAGQLPALTLSDSSGPLSRAQGLGWTARIDYGVRRPAVPGVTLGLWKPATWGRFKRTKLGRLVWSQRCARASSLPVVSGYAVIYAGSSTPRRRCGRRKSNRYVAHVYLGDVVVSVNIPHCFLCVDRGRGADPYDSLAGMRRVIKNLHRRRIQSTAP